MFFQSPKWIDGICKTYNLKQFSLDSEILTLVEIDSILFGHRLIALPFCEYGIHTGVQFSDAMLRDIESLKENTGAEYVEIRADQKLPSFFVSAEYLTFILEGPNIMSRVDRKLRQQIRKADSRLRLRKNDIAEFYPFYVKYQTRRGSPIHSERFFYRTGLEVYSAYLAENLISSIIFGSDQDQINWWGNINDPDFRNLNGTSWLLSKLIEERSSEKFRLDMGRTRKNSPIFSYKKQWGGIPKPIYSMTDERIGSLDPEQNKLKIASKLWRRMPVSMAVLLGPKLMKGIAL